MTAIFMSYRRGSTDDITYRIRAELRPRFESVFVDIDIPPGVRFPEHLAHVLSTCDAVLVIIGPDWVEPRLADPQDFVRIEVEVALSRGIAIIPVLVRGASCPDARQLPPSLKDLAAFQARTVASGIDFAEHVRGLTSDISRLVAGGVTANGNGVALREAYAVLHSKLAAYELAARNLRNAFDLTGERAIAPDADTDRFLMDVIGRYNLAYNGLRENRAVYAQSVVKHLNGRAELSKQVGEVITFALEDVHRRGPLTLNEAAYRRDQEAKAIQEQNAPDCATKISELRAKALPDIRTSIGQTDIQLALYEKKFAELTRSIEEYREY
jgi:hypothetical protein